MASKAKFAIINAFLKLIETEGYEKITVTSLVEECDISRQTFYYHFNDVEEMLAFAFERETEKICNAQEPGKWVESAKLYIEFLNKYDTLIRKASASSSGVYIYNLLNKSFIRYIATYIEKKTGRNPLANEDTAFLTVCAAHSFCGLVIDEIQKEKSNYGALIDRISKGFKLMPSN